MRNRRSELREKVDLMTAKLNQALKAEHTLLTRLQVNGPERLLDLHKLSLLEIMIKKHSRNLRRYWKLLAK